MTLALVLALLGSSARAEEPRAAEGLRVTRVPLAAPAARSAFAEDCSVGEARVAVSSAGAVIALPSGRRLADIPKGAGRLLLDDGELYAFGEGGAHRYAGEGKFAPLLKTPEPVTALAAAPGRLIFAMGAGIYQRHARGGFRLLFRSELTRGTRSIRLDPLTDVVYFATDDNVYALRRGVADLLLQDAGGELCLDDGKLRALSERRDELLTLEGLREALTKH